MISGIKRYLIVGIFLFSGTLSAQVTLRTPGGKIVQSPGGKIITSPVVAFSCGTSVVTYDGEVYRTIPVVNAEGKTQCWLAENLRYDSGDVWKAGTEFINPSGNDNTWGSQMNYGYQYSWTTAGGINGMTDPSARTQGICPSGWAMPSRNDWSKIIASNGGPVSGQSSAWSTLRLTMAGADGSGQTTTGYYWSSLHIDSSTAFILFLTSSSATLTGQSKTKRFSVRCIKSDAP